MLFLYLAQSHTSICYLVKELPWEMRGWRNCLSENSPILCESSYKSFNLQIPKEVCVYVCVCMHECICRKGKVMSSWLRKGKNNFYPFLWWRNSTLGVTHSLLSNFFLLKRQSPLSGHLMPPKHTAIIYWNHLGKLVFHPQFALELSTMMLSSPALILQMSLSAVPSNK